MHLKFKEKKQTNFVRFGQVPHNLHSGDKLRPNSLKQALHIIIHIHIIIISSEIFTLKKKCRNSFSLLNFNLKKKIHFLGQSSENQSDF